MLEERVRVDLIGQLSLAGDPDNYHRQASVQRWLKLTGHTELVFARKIKKSQNNDLQFGEQTDCSFHSLLIIIKPIKGSTLFWEVLICIHSAWKAHGLCRFFLFIYLNYTYSCLWYVWNGYYIYILVFLTLIIMIIFLTPVPQINMWEVKPSNGLSLGDLHIWHVKHVRSQKAIAVNIHAGNWAKQHWIIGFDC